MEFLRKGLLVAAFATAIVGGGLASIPSDFPLHHPQAPPAAARAPR